MLAQVDFEIGIAAAVVFASGHDGFGLGTGVEC